MNSAERASTADATDRGTTDGGTMTRGTRSRIVVRVVAAMAALAAVVATAPAHASSAHVFRAPFALGPTGGDAFSYHSATADGTVTVARVYPVPGVINCTKGGPFAKLLVKFRASRPVKKIVATYDSAAVDPFTFVQVGLRDTRHNWYGLTHVRGFVSGSGTVTLKPMKRQGRLPA